MESALLCEQDVAATHVSPAPWRPSGLGRFLRPLVVTALLAALITLTNMLAESRPKDALHRRTLGELADFAEWLADNGARGYIAEVGWPAGPDSAKWNELAEAWYRDAHVHGLWVTAWCAGEMWGPDAPLLIYGSAESGGPLAIANAQAEVLERQAPELRGVNLNGGEFGLVPTVAERSSWSNANPGTYSYDWRYDAPASLDYLAGRGITLIRLPFRWERIQPRLNGPLDAAELKRLKRTVRAAKAAGIGVILDLHNYGAYYLHDGSGGVRHAIGSRRVPVRYLADVWRRLSSEFATELGVVGYGLMNEPIGLPAAPGTTPAEAWEYASQRTLEAIRRNGDDKLILVPGYNWSVLRSWERHHPDGWIADPAGNYRYEAHHYWDSDATGNYSRSYLSEVVTAQDSR